MPKKCTSVCVYCGARNGRTPAYAADAARFGQGLAENGWRLVYGAGDVGLMGVVARAAIRAGGETLGVIPLHLLSREVENRPLTNCIVTETMHERKKVMFMNSDAVVLLPGGGGSLDEIFEVLTWHQLGLHAKPVIVLNTAQYWAPLLALIDHLVREGFADAAFAAYPMVVNTPAAALAALRAAMCGRNDAEEVRRPEEPAMGERLERRNINQSS